MKISQTVSLVVIKLARKLFYNTPVQKWSFTSYVYDTVFHLGYSEKELNTTYFGAKLSFPGRDFTITPGLVGGFYEKYELEIFQKICNVSRKIVDVGGNIGLYTVIAGRAGCEVIVFEPVPENQKYLQKNVKDNSLTKKVRLYKKAVSHKNGKEKIYLSNKNIGTHSLSAGAAHSTESITIDTVTLDKFLKSEKNIDVIKIDVEGYDGFVIDGALNLLKKHKPTLFVELVPSHLLEAGYNPFDFVSAIFKNYENVYLVDEVNNSSALVSKEILTKFITANRNANLIASTKAEHLDIIAAT